MKKLLICMLLALAFICGTGVLVDKTGVFAVRENPCGDVALGNATTNTLDNTANQKSVTTDENDCNMINTSTNTAIVYDVVLLEFCDCQGYFI